MTGAQRAPRACESSYGDLSADFGNAGIDLRGGLGLSGNGDADRPTRVLITKPKD
jgi:hypothetical protein